MDELIVLPARLDSVKAARDWAAKIAVELWGMDDHIPRLAASELVTNAVRHSARGQYLVVRAYIRNGRRTLEVWDQCPDLPALQHPDRSAKSGRGLFLLARLVANWGVRPLSPPSSGKIVYVEF